MPNKKASTDLMRDSKALQQRSQELMSEADELRARVAKLIEYGPKPDKSSTVAASLFATTTLF
jgi:hypothetical protein